MNNMTAHKHFREKSLVSGLKQFFLFILFYSILFCLAINIIIFFFFASSIRKLFSYLTNNHVCMMKNQFKFTYLCSKKTFVSETN